MEKENGAYDAAYVFSTEQQEEVRQIYQKYAFRKEKKVLSGEEEKMAQLRRLDRSVTRAGTAAALLAGLCGAACHGVGIALVQGTEQFALGSVIAVIGLVVFLVSYPIYSRVVELRRRKVEAQILTLCEELMK